MKRKSLFLLVFSSSLLLSACQIWTLDPSKYFSSNSNSNTSQKTSTSQGGGSSGKTSSQGGTTSQGGSTSQGGKSSGNTSDGDRTVTKKASSVIIGTGSNQKISTDIYYFSDVYNGEIAYYNFTSFFMDVYLPLMVVGGKQEYSLTRNGDVFNFSVPYLDVSIDINVNKDSLYASDPYISFYAQNYDNIPLLINGGDTRYARINKANSTSYRSFQPVKFDLYKYDIDVVDHLNEVYVPVNTLNDIYFGLGNAPFAFNGKDLYLTSSFERDFHYNSATVGSLEYNYYNDSPWKGQNRSADLALFTYNEMCFAYDYFYGLKEFRGFSTMDKYIEDSGYKDGLLSVDGYTYEESLARFIGEYIADGHAGFTKNSPFTGNIDTKPVYQTALTKNAKYTKLINDMDELTEDRKDAGKDIGYRKYNKTGIISFDQFLKETKPDFSYIDSKTYKELHEYDTYLFFAKAFQEIEVDSNIKNIVIDITCNSGGMVDTIPWLLAFMTDKPYLTYQHQVTKDISKLAFDIDLNRDGTYDENDTYKDRGYNFYVMTSSFSFSCGNAFPTFVADGKMAKVIGERSGGGSCVVGQISTASGTILRNSSPLQFGTYNDGVFTNNENGAPITEIPIIQSNIRSYFYDDEKIDMALNLIA